MKWIPDPPERIESRWQVFKSVALDLSRGFVPCAAGVTALVLGVLSVVTSAISRTALLEILLLTAMVAAATFLMCLGWAAHVAFVLYKKKQ